MSLNYNSVFRSELVSQIHYQISIIHLYFVSVPFSLLTNLELIWYQFTNIDSRKLDQTVTINMQTQSQSQSYTNLSGQDQQCTDLCACHLASLLSTVTKLVFTASIFGQIAADLLFNGGLLQMMQD